MRGPAGGLRRVWNTRGVRHETARQLVLYVHPSGHLNDLVVPAGAVTCMNAIPGPKLGRYAHEVADEEILEAAVVAIDLHWALGLSGLEPLVRHVRALRPDVPIVIGGITAGHYPEELLRRYAIDHVLQGDSEEAFAELVRRIRGGEPTDDIPNVHSRGRPPPRLMRMSREAFDATDCLTIDWFPTYARTTDWDAAAFPQGRTIPVSRGCELRCPECYGSYAATFGRGYRLRSPERLASLLERAARLGLRNLRLFVGKPSDRALTALLEELAARGPFRFATTVGIYLCTAPARSDLELLERAFSTPVALSMIPASEHVPRSRAPRLALEEARWREAAAYIASSSTLTLDAWTTTSGAVDAVRTALGTRADTPRVQISCASVWAVTRPVDGRDVPFDDVRRAAAGVWSFYAARVLSPALAELLAPYRLLDELDASAEDAEPAEPGPLAGFLDVIRTSFSRDRLPLLPELAFAVVPLERPRVTKAAGVRLHGRLAALRATAGELRARRGEWATLRVTRDHRGVTGHASLAPPAGTRALALVPLERAGAAPGDAALEAIATRGLIAITLPAPTSATSLALDLELVLRVQEVHVAVGDAGGVLARGRGELGYFRAVEPPPPPARRVPAPS